MARLVSLIILVVLIVFLGITFFQVLAPFLLPLFLAGVLAVLCQPLFRYVLRKTHHRTHLAAGITTVAVLTIVLVPLGLGVFFGSVQLYTLAVRTLGSPEWKRAVVTAVRDQLDLEQLVARAQPYLGLEAEARPINTEELVAEVQTNLRTAMIWLSQRSLGLAVGALGVLGSLVTGIVALLMFVIAFYYFLADGPALLAATEKLIPVHVDYQRQLLGQFNKVVRAVVLATLLAAIAQGLATAVLLYAFGFRHLFLVFVVATFAALVPLAGTWMVWGPYAIWLAYQGQWVAAVVLTAVGAVVIGTLDNFIRTYILHSDAKLHPLLAFVSVLGGLQVMGLWGVFVGPIVASCLHALVQIFNTELHEFSKEKFAQAAAGRARAAVIPTPSEAAPLAADVSAGAAEEQAASCAVPRESVPPHPMKETRAVEPPAINSPQSAPQPTAQQPQPSKPSRTRRKAKRSKRTR